MVLKFVLKFLLFDMMNVLYFVKDLYPFSFETPNYPNLNGRKPKQYIYLKIEIIM